VTRPQPSSTHTDRDREWIARIRAGDYDAFIACFRAYYNPALGLATRLLGSQDGAEDVVQDVFFRIWQRRETWVVTSNLSAYLHGAVRNRVTSHFRHRRVRTRFEGFVQEIFDRGGRCPDDDVIAADLDAAIQRIIDGLPSRCREVYELRWCHQLSYAEIAHILGISLKTVEAHVTTALKRLRAKLPDLL
jgi:RNA polymerase sigma-70 factor (ECF subfamily)